MEARSFRDHYEAVTELGAIVVGISTDTVERHRRFRQMNDLPFPLIADPDKRITRLYDVRRRLGLGTSRVTYVVDRHGIIRGVIHRELDMAGHVRDVLALLRQLPAAPFTSQRRDDIMV